MEGKRGTLRGKLRKECRLRGKGEETECEREMNTGEKWGKKGKEETESEWENEGRKGKRLK